ncbi:hypothetical protein [Sphingomonas sp. M1-B02]|uniref:hypothetical protein n=1 Tax=Sphingomonas sp. M1-B02 TaxID=3114300 RepID=UPI00223F79E5|nr:hypothetical protein [Sphingomonas sp. S6-11]UZK65052.1 hypothetical protein OKW87_11055 [Sphingomonas sp. S6-11]
MPTAALLIVTAGFAMLGIRQSEWFGRMLLLYCAGTAITVLYLFIGYLNGAPNDAIIQVTLVYIVAPIVWILIGTSAAQRFGEDWIVWWLVILTWLALLSIVLFFFAFLTLGPSSVQFLTEDANVNVKGGFAGATMLVYGSLIFLAGGFFASPKVLRWRIAGLVMPAALIVGAITSGRSAYIIAIPIGYAIGIALRPGLSEEARAQGGGIGLLPTIGMLIAGIGGVVALNSLFTQIDLNLIVNLFWGKLTSGGGDLRVEQADALWAGIEQSYGLGMGHGVGVRYLRSDAFPWRYELLPLASVLRVGIVGTIIYALPFLAYAGLLVRRFTAQSLSLADVYMAGGLVAALVATFTNPYMESFIFQWMYFLPVVALGMSSMDRNPLSPASRPAAAAAGGDQGGHVTVHSVA